MTLRKKAERSALTLIVVIWGTAIWSGLDILATYANTPGQTGRLSLLWPEDSLIQLADQDRPTLLIFLHPECPCSRASVEQLDAILARARNQPNVYAVFTQPKGWSEEEAKGSLWAQAVSIPGVKAILDPGAAESRRFGVKTSGHLQAYDSEGSLRFSGGITPSRGHQGGGPGFEAVIQLLNQGETSIRSAKVFGCSL